MLFQSVVTAYASVELGAARVANCDDVAGGVPVFALGQCRDGYAVDLSWDCWYVGCIYRHSFVQS